MADINKARQQINDIDAQMAELFCRRMDAVKEVGIYKKERGLPIFNFERERQVVAAGAKRVEDPDYRDYYVNFIEYVIELSKRYQSRLMDGMKIAYSGVEGAFANIAAKKIFKNGNPLPYPDFKAAYEAVEKGECDCAVLPIENSSNGSVRAVYSLLQQHQLSVVRSTRLCICHELLAMPGVKLEDITEIYSHQQAIGQCSRFLSSLSGVRVIPCGNTAEAAKLVAESGSRHAAAISSHPCAALYGLECVSDKIQDSENNYTRFFCVAKDPVIYAGANRISLILSFENKPGALYEILSKLAALDINMTKLESCPVAGSDFEFVFFLELEASVQDPSVLAMLEEMERSCAEFVFLGNYAEV